MGWISKRFNRNRAKWGKPMSPEKRKAPLRRIEYVIHPQTGLFGTATVMLECGHTAHSNGQFRARCVDCLKG